MGNLYKIVYCSQNHIQGGPAELDKQLHSILHSARANNSRQNVTGALLFNADWFAQVLEGPQASIERIFEQIQRDPRHGSVTVLESGEAEQREFPNWAMAHVQPPSEVDSHGLSSTLKLAFIQPEHGGSEVLELLKSLVIQQD